MSKAADAEQPTNMRTEFIAGVTTFLTIVHIVVVNLLIAECGMRIAE